MNYLYLVSGILALSAIVGHFTMGSKEFLKPVLASEVEIIPKKVMQSLFHYMSVFLILTTVILLLFSFGKTWFFQNSRDVSLFIGINYSGLALVQFIIAISSSIEKGLMKLFQWVFWLLIAIFAIWGSL